MREIMRDIRFRAWDLINRRWCGYELRGFVLIDDGNKEQEVIQWLPKRDGNVLMQYTGLKDKNGKEIYENDIVLIKDGGTWSHEEETMGRVEYQRSKYVFVDLDDIDDTCDMDLFDYLGDGTNRKHNPLKHPLFEVIGNIFEDKHLLEEK